MQICTQKNSGVNILESFFNLLKKDFFDWGKYSDLSPFWGNYSKKSYNFIGFGELKWQYVEIIRGKYNMYKIFGEEG